MGIPVLTPLENIPYDLSSFVAGKPAAGGTILVLPVVRPMAIPATGHQGRALTAATAEAVFTVKKNGVSIGTFTFAASGTVPTWTITATTCAAGDYLTVDAPASADATLANLGFSLMATSS